MAEKLYTVREASQYLGVTERAVIDLSEEGKITSYKVGGVYLRFRKEHLDNIKSTLKPAFAKDVVPYSPHDRASDFFYYNDFYILSLIVISILLYFIFYV